MIKRKVIGIILTLLAITLFSSMANASTETNNGGLGKWRVLERSVA